MVNKTERTEYKSFTLQLSPHPFLEISLKEECEVGKEILIPAKLLKDGKSGKNGPHE